MLARCVVDTTLPGRALDALEAERPLFHGADHDKINWQLGDAVLAELTRRVKPGWRTLETGCGYSTVVLAACGASHTVISPAAEEHDRIVAWCAAHDVSTDGVRFVADRSQRVLPTLAPGPLDLVLIDGDHAFPIPFLDWYYTAEALVTGGTLVIDDVQIRTIGVLRAFLRAERGRWRLVADVGTTAVFEKLTSPVTDPWSWRHQPWAAPTSGTGRRPARRLARRLLRR